MEKHEIEEFKKILTERLDDLLSQAGHTVSELMTRSDRSIEMIDRASEYTDQTLSLRIRSRESRLIKKIQEALERIENGTYGICESCGETIAIKRLMARPVTTKCIYCKEKEEQQELLAG